MKCVSCGGEVKLTDKKCPYCGRKLTETAGYRADLKSYKAKKDKSKQKLSEVIDENRRLIISAVLMILLAVGVYTATYVEYNAFMFPSDIEEKKSEGKYDEYIVEIQKYLDAGDYTGFVAFMNCHCIAEYKEPYDDLNLLYKMAVKYSNLVSNAEHSLMYGENAQIYDPEHDVFCSYQAIYEFYNDYDYNIEKIESDKYAEYIHDMRDEANAILKVYFGMDDEMIETYLESTSIDQKAYLEEVIIHE